MKKMMLIALMAVGLMANATNGVEQPKGMTKGNLYTCKCTTSGMSDIKIYAVPETEVLIMNSTHILHYNEDVSLYIGKVNKGATALVGLKPAEFKMQLTLFSETDEFDCKEMEEQ